MPSYAWLIFRSLVALFSFEAGAALFVGLSNRFLMERGEAIAKAGYLAIPTPNTLPALNSIQAAAFGALFFTLTCGAFFLFLAFAGQACFRFSLLSKTRARILHLLLAASACLMLGPSMATLPLLAGTLLLFAVLIPTGQKNQSPVSIRSILIHAGVPLMLALTLWASQYALPRGIYSGFRDGFLFENPAGNAIRHAYYTHTLFPAETFKPLNQKSQLAVKPLSPLTPGAKQAVKRLGHVLLENGPADYTLTQLKGEIIFKRFDTSFITDEKVFIAAPWSPFKAFAREADPFRSLRRLTWDALRTGFPLLIYMVCHCLITLLFRIFLGQTRAAVLATAVMGVAAFSAQGLLVSGNAIPLETRQTLNALIKEREKPGYARLVTESAASPSPLIRYRAALTTPSVSDTRTKRELLEALINDGDINVVCQAMGAMGRSGDPYYKSIILSRISTSPQWYIQWYGYGALRRLGWNPLNPRP